MRRWLCIGIAPALLALCACSNGGSETGNPSLPLRIGLNARSSDPEAVAVSTGTAGTVIAEAWVAFGEFAFLRDEQCALLGEYDIIGPTLGVVDLSRPDARITVEVAPASYCGLVVPLHTTTPSADLPDGAPGELAGHSIVLRGERADGTAFFLTHPEQDEIELAAEDGAFEVAAEGARLLLSFDAAIWMQDVDLDLAEVGADEVIRVDATSNRILLDAFERNLECSLELYDDLDDDGAVSADDPLLARCAVD
jgi:hypothetical protein